MTKKLLAVMTLIASPLAMAGTANYSTTTISGTGASVGVSASSYGYVEAATGYRHLDAGIAPDISVRDETYARGSASAGTDASVSATTFAITGEVVNATRIGESYTNVVANTVTVGVTADVSAYGEVGTFTAYDEVGASYSYESGSYVATGGTVGTSVYATDVDTVTDSYSSYGIYGAN